jgi:hypothetical protein
MYEETISKYGKIQILGMKLINQNYFYKNFGADYILGILPMYIRW